MEARQTILTEKLLAYFEAQYGKEVAYPGMGAVSVGQERLDAALDKLCAAMTVQRSETLKNLDLQAVQTRLVKAPGSVGTDYDPYRKFLRQNRFPPVCWADRREAVLLSLMQRG